MRKTKIICTIGPSVEDYDNMFKIAKYMDVARFNFSHGTHDSHKKMFEVLKKVRNDINKPIATLLDTKGPEIRTGMVKNNNLIELKKGEKVNLTIKKCECTDKNIYVNYNNLINTVKIGNEILIDDGNIKLKVLSKTKSELCCIIKNGGLLGNQKGVNLPGITVDLPDLTKKDIDDIKFGIDLGFDIIAASFTRNANCITKIKNIVKKYNKKILVLAKIENQEGVKNIDKILDVADGIMVARGDLGVEIEISKIPYIQKILIDKCNQRGKVVITATQMLDSMIKKTIPTRAEVTDVANAIYDGTDAIMLSGETASGLYPLEAVTMMNEIAIETEKNISNRKNLYENYQTELEPTVTNSVCKSIVMTAENINVKAIVAPTISGHTAMVLSMYKPSIPIFALSKDVEIVRILMLFYGVVPFLLNRANDTDTIVDDAIKKLKELKFLKTNDTIVVALGSSILKNKNLIKGHTNIMRVETI